MKKTTTKAISAERIRQFFTDACINKDKTSIRIEVSRSQKGRHVSVEWDYFELDKDNVITKCPRGWTKDFKGKHLTNLDCLPPMRSPFFGEEI